MSCRPRDARVVVECVSCGDLREVSAEAARMIRTGARGGRCRSCASLASSRALPVDGTRWMTESELRQWAWLTYREMSDRDRRYLHELAPLFLDDTMGVAA